MAIKRYDVVAVTGTYTDRNGVEKKRYMNCGVVFETEKGLSLKLEAMPVGSDGWFMLFEPRPMDNESAAQQPARKRQPAPVTADFDDDIPF